LTDDNGAAAVADEMKVNDITGMLRRQLICLCDNHEYNLSPALTACLGNGTKLVETH